MRGWCDWRRKILLVGAVGAITIGLGFRELRLWEPMHKPIDESRRTVRIERGPLEVTMAATGSFQALDYVDIGAQLSGQLKSVTVNPGDAVRRGQIVAVIDDTTARARLAQYEASLAAVRAQKAAKAAQIVLAKAQLDRNASLEVRQFVSKAAKEITAAAVTSLEAEADSLQALAESAAALVQQARADLRFAEVRAPMDGVVVTISARPGQTLNATQQAPVILRIINPDSIVLVAQVSEADIVRLNPGAEARFRLLGDPDRDYTGRVAQIFPMPNVVNGVVYYETRIDLVRADDRFRIGMTAIVSFLLERHDCVLKVPRSALPPDLRLPQEVTIVLPDRSPASATVPIVAANDTDGGIPCDEAARLGLSDGMRMVIPPRAPRKGGVL